MTALEKINQMYLMMVDVRGRDVTSVMIKQLREDYIVVRPALYQGNFSSDAYAIENALAALERARGDKNREVGILVSAIYGARMSLS